MLGGGNPVGSNPAGTGAGLNYIGNHAYAYSGAVDANNVETTALQFDTGNEYIVAEFNLSSSQVTGDDFRFRIEMNGEDIMVTTITGPYDISEHMNQPLKLVIPANTKVRVTFTNVSTTNAREWFATMSGRVYN